MTVILLVEDNDGTAKIYSNWLRTKGYDVRWLTHGSQALSFLHYTVPDLVILDLSLPDGVDGITLLKDMRSQGYGGPAIAVSGEVMVDEDDRDMFEGVYTKPLRLKQLLEAVSTVLSRPSLSSNT